MQQQNRTAYSATCRPTVPAATGNSSTNPLPNPGLTGQQVQDAMAHDSFHSLSVAASELSTLLECPVCMIFMVSPIEQCRNGHNICNACRQQLRSCPTCKEGYTVATRNLMAERLVDIIPIPCTNSSAGCTVITKVGKLFAHGICCPYRMYNCLKESCTWSGRKTEILQHFTELHKDTIHEIPDYNCTNIDINTEYHQVALTMKYNEMFWISMKLDPNTKTFSWCVQFIGPEEMASDFFYELRIRSKNVGRMFVKQKVNGDVEKTESIMKSGNCIVLGTGTVKGFIKSDKSIDYTIIITKC